VSRRLDGVWAKLVEHHERMRASGELAERRRAQQVRWVWQLVRDGLEHQLRARPAVRSAAPELEKAVLAGEVAPALAAPTSATSRSRRAPPCAAASWPTRAWAP
jgi:LAO/AO transport system kinase